MVDVPVPYHLSYIFPNGREAHYIIGVIAHLEEAFLLCLKEKNTIELNHYGFTLWSGYRQPTYEIKERIKKYLQG